MTAQQQLDVFGVSAFAHEGKVIVQSIGIPVELAPHEARRFMFYLARAYHDALARDGRRMPLRTPELV